MMETGKHLVNWEAQDPLRKPARREFLALVCLCTRPDSIWTGSPPFGRIAAATEGQGAAQKESVFLRYWPDSETQCNLDRFVVETDRDEALVAAGLAHLPVPARLIPAEALSAGDPKFVRSGVRLTLAGLFQPERMWVTRQLALLSLDIHFRLRGQTEDVRCCAWRFELGQVCNVSPMTTWLVPITEDSGLTLSVGSMVTLDMRLCVTRKAVLYISAGSSP